MKKIAMIPARYAATRFPAKLMQQLGDKTVIAATYFATKETNLFDDVIVVTDSEIIAEEIRKCGGNFIMSQDQHESGSDRIAEAARNVDVDVIINVQGDTPFVQKEPLQKLLQAFEDKKVKVASLMEIIEDEKTLADPNTVKVVVDKNNYSLLFSRNIIPFPRNKEIAITHYKHIGVYAFRKEALLQFTSWQITPLEDAEKIECLRYLENGIPLKMVLTESMGAEINVPEDLERALKQLKK